MNKNSIFLIAFLIGFSQSFGQNTKGFIIKTLPFQDILYQNPNLIIEKPIKDNYSVEMLFALRNGDIYFPGGEGPPSPNTTTCSGFTVGVSNKYYISKKKLAPNAWFTSGLTRYNETRINEAKILKYWTSEPRIVNLSKKGPEFGIIVGRQSLFYNHLTIEFYSGAGYYLQIYQEQYISGPKEDVIRKEYRANLRPYLGFTIGWLFRKTDEKNRTPKKDYKKNDDVYN